jgi:CBS domain-containing protein
MRLEALETRDTSAAAALAGPGGALLRPSGCVAPEDSLDRVAAELRRSGNGLVPVVEGPLFIGIVTERSLGLALADGRSALEPAESAMVEAVTVRPYDTAASALRMIAEGAGPTLVVVDDVGRLMGLVSPSDLYPRRRQLPRPALVGGMATPFGVYLTNGAVSGGAKGWALAATGATMFLMLVAGQVVSYGLAGFFFSRHAPQAVCDGIMVVLPILLFLLAMRLIPLSGTHGAEHMVVHAMERGEELRPEVVRRMPRVHPRCGTNIAVGATLFVSTFDLPFLGSTELSFFAAAIVTYLFWRPIGNALQFYVTTKRPTDRQIESGIRAANELLDRYSRSTVAFPTPFQRILRSGILHVMSGSLLTFGVVYVITHYVLHVDIGLN